jgi:signal transduction histidine kinase
MGDQRRWKTRFRDLREEATSIEREQVQVIDDISEEPTTRDAVGATLTVMSGPEVGRVIYVGGAGGILGRGDEADFVFADSTISRAHASLRMHAGRFWFRDLGSSNGSFLDGNPVSQRVELPPTARLRVGRQTVLQFTALDEIGREREYQRMLIEERLRWEKERSKELEQQAAELRRANADLEQFAFAASHDLQEPLRMVTSYLRLLSERFEGELDEDGELFIGFALDGAERMKQLLDDLLAYCRLGQGGLSLDAVDLCGVVDQVSANLAVAIQESGARVDRDRLPVVLGNRSQLVQLMQNLVANAIKFRGDATPDVHVGVKSDDDAWTFTVRDNGIGMDPAAAERIFQIFQRLHSREEYPGTGIGLTIAKKIVEQHGGTIWVESTPGAGTTFYFTLPIEGDEIPDMTQTML